MPKSNGPQSLKNPASADVYFGRGPQILEKRRKIYQRAIEYHQNH